MDINKTLSDIYYNPKTGFKTGERLLKEARKTLPNISQKQIRAWLNSQEERQINKYNNRPIYFKITAPPDYYQMDITFLPQLKAKNKGYSAMLCMVEIATRKAYVVPLKTKSEGEIAEAINKLVKQLKPKAITTDNGSEFTNKTVQALFKKNNIIHYKTQPGDKYTLSIVERFNRTVKNYLRRYFTANNTYEWINVIDDIVENYNNSYQNGIHNAPNEVTDAEVEQVRAEAIIHNADAKAKVGIDVGDIVRTKYKKTIFDKENEVFSKGLYEVVEIVGYKYKLKSQESGEVLKTLFGINSLQKVKDVVQNPLKVEGPDKKQVVKEYKTKQKVKKEGLDEANVIQGRPKRNKVVSKKWDDFVMGSKKK